MNRKVFRSIELGEASYYLLILLVGTLACVARFRWNGLVYGFDYGIYQPDGAHYTYQTLRFLGNTPLEANRLVFQWYESHSFGPNTITATSLIPANNAVWGLIAPRVLYPLLSMPFVSIFGIPGMVVIPMISFVTILLVIANLGLKLQKARLSLLLVLLLCSSPTILRWSISNCADALLAAILAIAASLIFSFKPKWQHLLPLQLLILAAALTRFSLTVWIPLLLVMFAHRKLHKTGLAISITVAILSFLPSFYFAQQIERDGRPGQILTRSIEALLEFIRVVFIEVGQLLVMDRILASLLVVAVLLSIFSWKDYWSGIFLASLTGVISITAINPVAGVNFRYQMPSVAFMAILILIKFNELGLGAKHKSKLEIQGIFRPSQNKSDPEGQ